MDNLMNPNEKYDYITSLKMAHYFCEIGFQLLDVNKDKLDGDVYSFFVGATNLGIGIELYLKSFIAFSGTSEIPQNHNLKNLYLQINEQIRDKIEQICQENNIFKEKAKTFYIRGKKDKPNQSSPYTKSKNIEELLKKHNRLFIDFRYMYEKGREQEKHFIIEYENLKTFIDSLNDIEKKLFNNDL